MGEHCFWEEEARKGSKVQSFKESIFLKLFHTSELLDVEKIFLDEAEMTALFTNPINVKNQDPHTDYHLVNTYDPTNIAWTTHLPLNQEEGSYIYIWSGQSCGTVVRIEGGQCLLF